MLKPVAITMGDAAGIGPEIIAMAFQDAPDVTRGCFVVGDVETLRRANAIVQRDCETQLPLVSIGAVPEVVSCPPRCMPVWQAVPPSRVCADFGQISAEAGRMAGECVVWAARAALRGEVAALVTAPLHKKALSAAGAPFDAFAGHTELLQAEAAAFTGRPRHELPVRMMLANDELRVVLVSIHMALRQAIDAVTQENVLQTLRITQQSLSRMLGRAPRIAVAGLNPHAGESGLFGHEEVDIIAPAIQAAQAQGLQVSGPYAPDTVFMRARRQMGQEPEFDVVLAMYHDQGLIPVKYLGVDKGVNVTLGLPLVRTSPDHGTAFDIAGTGCADPASLIEAIRMARSLSVEG